MPNSQETVLEIIFTEDLVLTREQMLFHPLCPYYSRQKEAIYPLRAPGWDINLANVIQTIPNSQETCLVGRSKVLAGVVSKQSTKYHSIIGHNFCSCGAIKRDKTCYYESHHAQ